MDSKLRKQLRASAYIASTIAAIKTVSEIIGIAGLPDSLTTWRSWLAWTHIVLTDTPWAWLVVLAASVALPFIIRYLTRKPVVHVDHITYDQLPANVDHGQKPVATQTESKLSRVVGDLQKLINDLDEAVSSKDGKNVRVVAKAAWDFVAANVHFRKLTKLDISGMYTFSPVCRGSEDDALQNAPHTLTKLRTLISQLDESDLK